MTKTVLLTGVGGFVGSHTLRHILENTDWNVIGLDSFRHRGKLDRVQVQLEGMDKSRYTNLIYDLKVPFSTQFIEKLKDVDYVISMASESHVDRSITEPRDFIENNVTLILTLLEWTKWRNYDQKGNPTIKPIEKFIQISTDEVYGPIDVGGHQEGEAHRPSNPYSASKASQESIAYSYWRTYQIPIMITNTMNIVGEMQDTEKWIPMVMKALLNDSGVRVHASKDGVIGTRFYLHARNQADALVFLLKNHTPAMYPAKDLDRFNVVGSTELSNLEIAEKVATYMNRTLKYQLEDFHSSRPGHDLRYGLDGSKISQLGWEAPVDFDTSFKAVVEWSLAHSEWLV